MKILVSEIFELNKIIDKLYTQRAEYNLSLGLNIYDTMKKLNEVETYIFQRLKAAIPNENKLNGSEKLTDDEEVLYYSIMLQEIELDIPQIDITDIMKNEKVVLDINDIGLLKKILKK